MCKIGSWCTIGAGATVINNIENNMKVVGVPAKSLHDIGGIVNQIGLLCNERRYSYAA